MVNLFCCYFWGAGDVNFVMLPGAIVVINYLDIVILL